MESSFLPRTLWRVDDGKIVELAHTQLNNEFCAHDRPLVILGASGMGKTTLLEWFAQTHGYRYLTARQLILAPRPGQPIDTEKGLVIDALDELGASSPDDALMKVLEALGKRDYPRFVISCRASDWFSAASAEIIKDILGQSQHELYLGALTDEQVQQILRQRLGAEKASNLVEHLKTYRLSDWLGNPQTLELIIETAKSGSHLPEGRAELFQLTVKRLLSEHKAVKSSSVLAERDAFDAAGAACAALIMGGFDTIGRTAGHDHALSLIEAKRLPGGAHLSQVLGTRLFDAAGVDRFNYMHRSIGEYLGARWLAQQADTSRKRRRLLALFHRTGLVPASLRGIHAWLALDPHLAPEVLTRDPVGVIEYGDAEQLSPQQAQMLLLALNQLAARNPGFLPVYHSVTLRGVLKPGMESELRAVLERPEKSFQLRLLLLESIQGTLLASKLVSTFQTLVRNPAEIFSIRRAALECLSASLSTEQSLELVHALTSQEVENSTQLALDLTGLRGYDSFDNACIVKLVMACAYHDFRFGEVADRYDDLTDRLPSHRIAGFLDHLTHTATAWALTDEGESAPEVADLMIFLILRYLHDETIVASDLLRWLRFATVHDASYYPAIDVDEYLKENDTLRHELQRVALLEEKDELSISARNYNLLRISRYLLCSESDAIALLDTLHPDDPEDARWREVVTLISHSDDSGVRLRAAARVFASNHPDHLQWIDRLPLRPAESEVTEHVAGNEQINASERLHKKAELRNAYQGKSTQILAGEFDCLLQPAMIYLGQWQEYKSDAPAHERLADWLGQDLAHQMLCGFEAYLQRIPSTLRAADVANYYCEQDWIFDVFDIGSAQGLSPPIIIVAVFERHRTEVGLKNLTDLALMSALFAFHHWFDGKSHPLHSILENEIQARALWKEALRLLYEPQLSTGYRDNALDDFLYHEKNRELVVDLVTDWLQELPSISSEREKQLITMLLNEGEHEVLRALAESSSTPPTLAHQLNRAATGLLVSFEATVERLANGPVNEQLLRCLRTMAPAYFCGFSGRVGKLSLPLTEWIIASFRTARPHTQVHIGDLVDLAHLHLGSDEECIADLIEALGSLTTPEAVSALIRLCNAPHDTYTALLLDAKAKQQRLYHESAFTPSTLDDLIAIASDQIPCNSTDLQAWVLEELDAIQARIKSDDVDSWRGFYRDDQRTPWDEERCRDYLLTLLRQGSSGVAYDLEKQVAAGKKVDITCSAAGAGLPIEIKGQWHRSVWSAADQQLDTLYTTDHKAGGFGIYLVLWFGKQESREHRLKRPPEGGSSPCSPDEMARMLESCCQAYAQGRVKIVVLDLARSTGSEVFEGAD